MQKTKQTNIERRHANALYMEYRAEAFTIGQVDRSQTANIDFNVRRLP